MRHFLLFILLTGLTICTSCSSDDDPTVPVPGEEPAVSGTVGPSGGTLSNDDIVLTVPAGALADEVLLRLFREEDGDPVPADRAGPIFRIEGLPETFALPLPVSLRLFAAGADSLAGLLGEEVWVQSLDGRRLVWEAAPAVNAAGWAELAIPPRPDLDKTATADEPGPALRVTTVRSTAKALTQNGFFHVFYHPEQTPADRIVTIGGYLEEAYLRLYTWGFRHEGFSDWPVSVYVYSLPDTICGWWAGSSLTLGGRLAINADFSADLPEVRRTATHEMFHFFQYFYDYRPVRERLGGSLAPWLNEACSTWVEAFITDDPHYVPLPWIDRELAPLSGIAPRPGVNAAGHGYGLASLIFDIMTRQAQDRLIATYEGIRQGRTPIMALLGQVEPPLTDWYGDFLTRLLLGTAFRPVSTLKVIGASSGTIFTIASVADTLDTEMLSIQELGGKLVEIRLEDPLIDERATLELTTTGGNCQLAVFGLNLDDPLVLLGQSDGPVLVLENLQGLVIRYSQLLVLLANRQVTPPECFELSNVELTTRVKWPRLPYYDFAAVSLNFEGAWSDGSGSETEELYISTYEGSFDGANFTASWDSVTTGGFRYVGHFNVTVDPHSAELQTWNARHRVERIGYESYEVQISGTQIDLPDLFDEHVEYLALESEACAAITAISWVQYNADGTVLRELESWGCNSMSEVELRLVDTWPPGP